MASFLNTILDNTKQLLQTNTSNNTHSTSHTSLLHNSDNSSNSETHSEDGGARRSKKHSKTSSQVLDNGTFLFDSYDQEYCEIAHHIKEQLRQLSKSIENSSNNNTNAHDLYQTFQKMKKQVQMAQGAVKNMEIELRGNLMDNYHSSNFDIKEAQERVVQYKRDAKDLASRLDQAKQAFLLTLHNENTLDSDEDGQIEDDENYDDLEYGGKNRNLNRRKTAKKNQSMERMELLNKKSQSTIDRMLSMTHSMNQSGEESMSELGRQRETIEQSRSRVKEMDGNLSITKRLLGGLEWNEFKTKLCIFIIIIVLSIAIAIAALILVRRILGWVGIKIL